MKIVSWNVNGLRACINKGFIEFFKEKDADIFCIQETKMQEGQAELKDIINIGTVQIKKAIPERRYLQNKSL